MPTVRAKTLEHRRWIVGGRVDQLCRCVHLVFSQCCNMKKHICRHMLVKLAISELPPAEQHIDAVGL